MKHRMAAILPAYLCLYACSYLAAFLLRFDFALQRGTLALFWGTLPFLFLIKGLVCLAFGEWKRTYRYATLTDMSWIVAGAVCSAALIYLFDLIVLPGQAIPRAVILIDAMLSTLLLSGLRTGPRIYLDLLRPFFAHGGTAPARTIIFGADTSGLGVLRALQTGRSSYQIVGFVETGIEQRGSLLAGVPVLPLQLGWKAIARKLRAKHLLIPSNVSGKCIRDILAQCVESGLKAHVIPGVNEIVDGRYKLAVRDVTISDLLRREPAQLDMDRIAHFITGRRVLVTGGAGSIGSELCRQILSFRPAELTLLDQSELGVFTMEQELQDWPRDTTTINFIIADVTQEARLRKVMEAAQPDLVFHAAAYKHVPLMEHNPHEAIRNNVLGTKNVVDLADELGVGRLVLISTDKAVRPSSVMGATKLLAEKYLQAKASVSRTEMITVRFGNVLNSAGSVVPTFRKQIEAGGPVTVTHPEMVRFFMTIPEAVQLVLQAGAIGRTGEVLILEMGEPVRIFDLAKDMIYLSGLKFPEDIDIVFTGMRPGEKLYEELFYEAEEGARRVGEKIFSARRRHLHYSDVQWEIQQLEASLAGDKSQILAALWKLVAAHVNEEAASIPHRAAA